MGQILRREMVAEIEETWSDNDTSTSNEKEHQENPNPMKIPIMICR